MAAAAILKNSKYRHISATVWPGVLGDPNGIPSKWYLPF